MILYRAAKAGFCFGVKRAIELAEKTARDRDGPIYSLGHIIHNTQVVEQLSQQGIIKIDSLDEAMAGGTLLLRSHGEGSDIIQQAQDKSLDIIDTTCPFVSKAQKIAATMAAEGKKVVIVGDRNHPEVKGIMAWTQYTASVVRNSEEAKKLPFIENMGVLAQTTQALQVFQAVVEELNNKTTNLTVVNTICHATTERQNAALELAHQVDLMLVIGDKKSANTAKLTTLCRDAGTTTYQVETAIDINPLWLQGVQTVGITAGASTPQSIIEAVETRMKELDEMTTNEDGIREETMISPEQEDTMENTEPVLEEEAQEGMSDAMDVKSVRTGEIVKGVVVQVTQDEVLVDVGAKSEGVIPLRELASFAVESPQELVKVGDEIDVYVLKAEDNEGRLILSKEMADAEKAWDVLQEKLDSGESVEGVVKEVVKGGLLVDIGIKAFMPASLVDRGYIEDLNNYLGTTLQARIIELNQARKKVILSRKVLLEEEYAKKREEMLQTIQEGMTVKGIVRRLTNFGAFVDIGGIDGLLHISEMAWHRINHPSEVVNVGDEIDVMILKVDRENEKISLGLKQVLPNPWDTVDEKYKPESIITAKVVRLAPFGAFVQLEPGVEGLVHISHLADHHVVKPDEVVQEGEEIQVKVLSVDKEEKRIRLSIREINKQKEPRQPKEPQPVAKSTPEVNTNDGGNVTIGDVFGALFEDNKD